MFAPKPEIILLRRIFDRVFGHLENKLDTFAVRQDERDTLLSNLCQRVHDLERRDHIRHDRYDEIEHLQNLCSNDGESICNYSTSRFYEDDEV
jgi:demethoxyubiquinone hydroxylase (CLK1/Coq7/Cat5 family)